MLLGWHDADADADRDPDRDGGADDHGGFPDGVEHADRRSVVDAGNVVHHGVVGVRDV